MVTVSPRFYSISDTCCTHRKRVHLLSYAHAPFKLLTRFNLHKIRFNWTYYLNFNRSLISLPVNALNYDIRSSQWVAKFLFCWSPIHILAEVFFNEFFSLMWPYTEITAYNLHLIMLGRNVMSSISPGINYQPTKVFLNFHESNEYLSFVDFLLLTQNYCCMYSWKHLSIVRKAICAVSCSPLFGYIY